VTLRYEFSSRHQCRQRRHTIAAQRDGAQLDCRPEPRVAFHQRHHPRGITKGRVASSRGKKRKALLRWIETGIKADFAGRILPADALVMERWAQLEATTAKTGRRLPLMGSLLAATALGHDLTLVTRNVADFKAAGMSLLDPWAGN